MGNLFGLWITVNTVKKAKVGLDNASKHATAELETAKLVTGNNPVVNVKAKKPFVRRWWHRWLGL